MTATFWSTDYCSKCIMFAQRNNFNLLFKKREYHNTLCFFLLKLA